MCNKVKVLGKRLYLLNLKNLAELESLQSRSRFSIHFSTIFFRKTTSKCMENYKRN